MTPIKGIKTQVTIGSIRAKVDGSLGFNVSTPELSPGEKVAFMDLQNQVLQATFLPLDNPEATIIPIDTEREIKSHSTRLRNVIYALWASKKEAGEYVEENFQTYYNKIMEAFITKVKGQLEDYGRT